MAIFTLDYLQESKQKYDPKIVDRAADVFRKLQKILYYKRFYLIPIMLSLHFILLDKIRFILKGKMIII